MGVPKERQALGGPQLGVKGAVCWVQECTEGVGCSFLSGESGVVPAAGAPEIVRHLLLCHLRPRLRRWGCCAGGWELWVRELKVRVVEQKCEVDVAG